LLAFNEKQIIIYKTNTHKPNLHFEARTR